MELLVFAVIVTAVAGHKFGYYTIPGLNSVPGLNNVKDED